MTEPRSLLWLDRGELMRTAHYADSSSLAGAELGYREKAAMLAV
jgi:hypothetical protein